MVESVEPIKARYEEHVSSEARAVKMKTKREPACPRVSSAMSTYDRPCLPVVASTWFLLSMML
jgi:hypothetical protein